jgi:creatinine amidohydrolase
MDALPKTTSSEVAVQDSSIAVLPVGSFEQHAGILPLATDTIVACAIAEAVAARYDLFLLPPITIACSHEHADFPGTVSISAETLYRVLRDIQGSLEQQGIRRLVLVNGHGGNYVLSNFAQEANVRERRVALFPHRDDWDLCRKAGGLVTTGHEDMHGGELETSILLRVDPAAVRPEFETADHVASDRSHLLMLGMKGYTVSGIIGRPSLATAEKGQLALDALVQSFESHLTNLMG